MQNCKSVDITDEELQQFNQFKQQKRMEEARATAQKLELDLLEPVQDRQSVRFSLGEAVRLGIGAVCVPPSLVRFCSAALGPDTCVSVIACISSPNGGDTTDIKVKAVKRAIKDGADEVEVTAPLSQIKENNWSYVKKEFKKINSAAKKRAARITLETPLFNEAQIKKCCSLAADVGIVCLRSASGAHSVGKTEDDVKIMLSAGRDKIAVKSSGAADAPEFFSATACGAAKVSTRNALQIAADILSRAEKQTT